jgi:hypothetical protein
MYTCASCTSSGRTLSLYYLFNFPHYWKIKEIIRKKCRCTSLTPFSSSPSQFLYLLVVYMIFVLWNLKFVLYTIIQLLMTKCTSYSYPAVLGMRLLRYAGRRFVIHCGCRPSRLGFTPSENGTTDRWGHKVHVGGSRVQTVPEVERRRLPEPHLQMLLGRMEIAVCEEWLTRAPLGICRRPIRYSPDSFSSEQSERRAYRST